MAQALLLDVNNGFWPKNFDRELFRCSLLIFFSMEITCVLPLCTANQYHHKWWKSFFGKIVYLNGFVLVSALCDKDVNSLLI